MESNVAIKAFGGTKGGPGKTTVATNAAVMQAEARRTESGYKGVLLSDSDKMQLSVEFVLRRLKRQAEPAIQFESMLSTGIFNQLSDRRDKYTDIIVDCGGHDSEELRGVLQAADEFIIPMRPNQLDIDVLPKLHKLLEINQDYNPDLRCRVLMCQVRPGTLELKRAFMEEILKDFPLCGPLMDAHTTFRGTYESCQTTGLAVIEFARRNEKAFAEMKALHEELWQ
jgi:chromosome partitioning protein